MKFHLPTILWPILCSVAFGVAAVQAMPVSRLQVRIVTGAQDLSANDSLELRIYEIGRPARRVPLVHGEVWLQNSTHIIPVTLSDELDPRNVLRFSLFFRSTGTPAPAFEIVTADVEIRAGSRQPERLLNATLSGVIAGQGELATPERDAAGLTCANDSDCDDGRTCNGREQCLPRSVHADARGCVKGTPVVCPVNQVCGQAVGCRGVGVVPTEPKP